MDSIFKNCKKKVLKYLNASIQPQGQLSPQIILARSKVKAAQNIEEIAYALLDANLHEMFVEFFLEEGMMQLLSMWEEHCESRAKEQLEGYLSECSQEDRQYFYDTYKKEAIKRQEHAKELRNQIIEDVRKEVKRTARQIKDLQNYLDRISSIIK